MKKVILMLLAAGALIFNSCTRTGPPGPQGPQGPTGYDGNANVIGTDPFTVFGNTWLYTPNAFGGGEKAWFASFTQADISTAVANNGMVIIYVKYPDGTWKNLPDIYYGTSFSYNFSQGGFEIYFTNIDGSAPSQPGTWTFRAVIVPSSVREANPDTNWNNYNETMKALSATNAVAATSAN